MLVPVCAVECVMSACIILQFFHWRLDFAKRQWYIAWKQVNLCMVSPWALTQPFGLFIKLLLLVVQEEQ